MKICMGVRLTTMGISAHCQRPLQSYHQVPAHSSPQRTLRWGQVPYLFAAQFNAVIQVRPTISYKRNKNLNIRMSLTDKNLSSVSNTLLLKEFHTQSRGNIGYAYIATSLRVTILWEDYVGVQQALMAWNFSHLRASTRDITWSNNLT
jgi:hypothetical protein